MCGINGIFAYHAASNLPSETELLATREAMRTRGPDGSGAWWSEDRRCGLGHRRLSIVDLSDRAAQPMMSEDGSLVAVFNGQIYNYPQLRSELEGDGVCFRTASDTEVLLHLYARCGAGMVQQLRGMFAFAIWDGPRRSLFLARDPYGIKPLYTANDGCTFRFASQVKALLAGNQVSRDPEPAGIVGFHLFGNVPEPFTLYREIHALPAGHTQWIDANGPNDPRSFSNIAEILARGSEQPLDARQIPERVRTGVAESVRAHLLSDVEVGIFLSAGVDSGALLGCMRDARNSEIAAITLAFEDFRGTLEDQAPLAARTCQLYGVRHIVRQFAEQEFVEDLPRILNAMDQPSIDGVNTWFIAKAAKEVGLKVALSGVGGDEIFGSYPSFLDLPRWHRCFGPLARVPGLGVFARKLIPHVAPALARRRPKTLGLLEYADTWAGTYLLRRGLFLPHELPEVLDPDVAEEGMRRLQPLRLLEASLTPDPRSDYGRVCALESAHYMRNQLLRDCDWASMAHGIEIRTPLVDYNLLATLSPVIPAFTPGVGKAALAKVPSVPLSDEIVTRAKTGFCVPFRGLVNPATDVVEIMDSSLRDRPGLLSRQWSRAVLKVPPAPLRCTWMRSVLPSSTQPLSSK
jgi:asparagine synthase (glutamine-hydrolysing)